jgi:hypothetical protein
MRELLAIVLALLAAVAAAAIVWLWWRSPIPTFLVFTPVLHGLLLGVALHYIGATLKVSRWTGWMVVAALSGLASITALTFGQYWSDAYAYHDATRRAASLVAPAPLASGSPASLDVLDSYDRNVVLPRTGRTGIRGYTQLRFGQPKWRGPLRMGEGLILIVLAVVLSAPRRQRRAADDAAPQ